MPEICRFLGMVIRMFINEHPPAHFHVKYAEFEATVSIETGKIIQGELPGRLPSIIMEWTNQRRTELLDNWQRARNRDTILPVKPPEDC